MLGTKAGRPRQGRFILGTAAVGLAVSVASGALLGLVFGLTAFLLLLVAGALTPAIRRADWRGFRGWWRLQTQPVGKGTAVASINAVWPPLRRLLKPDFVWVNYPGIEAHKRAYFPPWVEKMLRPAFPTGIMRFDKRWGVVLSSIASAETLDRSPQLLEELLAELRRQFPNDPPIALAGRLPSIAASSDVELTAPFTKGDLGTVCSMAASAREAARLVGKAPEHTTLGVVGSKGFIGAKLVQSLAGEFDRTVALDARYADRTNGDEGVLYTDQPEDIRDAEAIIVLTPKGADMATVASHIGSGAVVADDTHPEMPADLRERIERRGATVLKATLGDERFSFTPPIPDFRRDDIPGCILEALVIVHRGSDVLRSQADFNRAAHDLGFRARLAPHLSGKRRHAAPAEVEGGHAPLARLPREGAKQPDPAPSRS